MKSYLLNEYNYQTETFDKIKKLCCIAYSKCIRTFLILYITLCCYFKDKGTIKLSKLFLDGPMRNETFQKKESKLAKVDTVIIG